MNERKYTCKEMKIVINSYSMSRFLALQHQGKGGNKQWQKFATLLVVKHQVVITVLTQ
jgi:hypothetical protein